MSNIELPARREQAVDVEKRRWRVGSLITVAALSASLIGAAAGPASAAVREPALSLTTAARSVHVSGGRFTLDTLDGEKDGVGSQALSAEGAVVASLNEALDRGRHGVVADAPRAVPAAAQDTTITVLPGITLTIFSFGIQLDMTKEAVTEVENVAGFGQSVAALVGSILSAAGVTQGAAIAAIVGAALGVGSAFLKLCTASDGSATFTVSLTAIPSCSGLHLVAAP